MSSQAAHTHNSIYTMAEPPPLSSEQISTYLHDGILVVNNILSPHEVIDAQLGLATTLIDDYGVDVNDLEQTGWRLINASSTNGAGMLYVFMLLCKSILYMCVMMSYYELTSNFSSISALRTSITMLC